MTIMSVDCPLLQILTQILVLDVKVTVLNLSNFYNAPESSVTGYEWTFEGGSP